MKRNGTAAIASIALFVIAWLPVCARGTIASEPLGPGNSHWDLWIVSWLYVSACWAVRAGAHVGRAYPGPFLMLAATLLPLLGLLEYSVDSVLTCASLMQTALACLRAMTFSAVFCSAGPREQPLANLQQSIGILLLEQALLLPFNLVVYGYVETLDCALILKIQALMASATMLAGCCGIWLGLVIDKPQRALHCARWLTFMLLVGEWLLGVAFPQLLVLLLIGLSVWLVVFPPNARDAWPVTLAFLAAAVLCENSQTLRLGFDLNLYNPLAAIWDRMNLLEDAAIYACCAGLILLLPVSRRLSGEQRVGPAQLGETVVG